MIRNDVRKSDCRRKASYDLQNWWTLYNSGVKSAAVKDSVLVISGVKESETPVSSSVWQQDYDIEGARQSRVSMRKLNRRSPIGRFSISLSVERRGGASETLGVTGVAAHSVASSIRTSNKRHVTDNEWALAGTEHRPSCRPQHVSRAPTISSTPLVVDPLTAIIVSLARARVPAFYRASRCRWLLLCWLKRPVMK